MIEESPGTDWRDLQHRVATILNECGLIAETTKVLTLARGKAEIDVFATDLTTTPPSLYLCECKRWSSRVPQAEVQAFRTVVSDAGAHFGLFISSQGFQSGAYNVAEHTNIHLLNWIEFQLLFVERWCRRFWVPSLRSRADVLARHVDPASSDAAIRLAHGGPITPAEAVGFIVFDMWGPPFNGFLDDAWTKPVVAVSQAIWQCRDTYKTFLPESIANASCLRGLFDAILDFAASWSQRRDELR